MMVRPPLPPLFFTTTMTTTEYDTPAAPQQPLSLHSMREGLFIYLYYILLSMLYTCLCCK